MVGREILIESMIMHLQNVFFIVLHKEGPIKVTVRSPRVQLFMSVEVLFHIFSSFNHPCWDMTANLFNKCQMFIVIMRRKEQRAGEDFKNNAGYAPDIAFMVPMAALEDDFRTSVLTCIYNPAMRVRVIQSTS